MPSPFDFAANPTPSTASLNVTDLIRMYTGLIKALPRQEEDIIIQKFVLESEIDIHDLETIAGQPLDVVEDEFDDHADPICYRKQIPLIVHSDPLVYNNTNASGFTFPTPDTAPGNSEGGAGITDGSSYLLIDDDPDLKPTDKFSIAYNLYIPTAPAPGVDDAITEKANGALGWTLQLTSTTIIFSVVTATGTLTLTIPSYPKDTWFKLVISYDSAFGARAKLNNGIVINQTSNTGTVIVSTDKLSLFASSTGTRAIKTGTGIAWFVMLHGEVIAANGGLWPTSYQDGLIITDPTVNSNYEEITTIPFLGDLEAQTNMTSGLFVSG